MSSSKIFDRYEACAEFSAQAHIILKASDQLRAALRIVQDHAVRLRVFESREMEYCARRSNELLTLLNVAEFGSFTININRAGQETRDRIEGLH